MKISAILAFLFLFTVTAAMQCVAEETQAGEEQKKCVLGIGVGSSISEYTDYSPLVLPFPMFEYEDNLLYIRGYRGGVKLYHDKWNEISVFVQYDPQSFFNSRTGNSQLEHLDNRYSSLYSGAAYRLISPYGILGVSGMTDILGVSHGTIFDANYSLPIKMDDFTLVPSAGVRYADALYNDYYYGVGKKESRKSGLSEYEASYSFSPYIGLTASYDITEQLNATVYGKGSLLGNEIQDSPMVDKSCGLSFGAMLNYSF